MKIWFFMILVLGVSACGKGEGGGEEDSNIDYSGIYSVLQKNALLSCTNGGELILDSRTFKLEVVSSGDRLEFKDSGEKSASTATVKSTENYSGLIDRNGEFIVNSETIAELEGWLVKFENSYEGKIINNSWSGSRKVNWRYSQYDGDIEEWVYSHTCLGAAKFTGDKN